MITPSKYDNLETVRAEPEARSMIETFRAIGYSVETAVADIIDNSISAGASNIWIDFEWRGASTYLKISDNGHGMEEAELIQAMRPGSRSPLEDRGKYDLGRFGLGLKTASFSQCRKLTVLSKKVQSFVSCFTWDLDFVNTTGNWDLIKRNDSEFHKLFDNMKSGTVVVWENLDRLVMGAREEDKDALNKFMETAEMIKKHIAMVFHRFLEQGKFSLFFQQRKVEPWDPYLKGVDGLQPFPEEYLQNGLVTVKGYVLPHKSKISENLFRIAEGPKGWNAQQGFYIYRNQRLLVAGDWLGMFRKEEHFKLARIQIDLPNTLDAEWQIDIKKSVARPPVGLKNQLKAIATLVRGRAVQVYRHKGKILQRRFIVGEFQHVWSEKVRHGKRFYVINRDHPAIRAFIESAIGQEKQLNMLLRLIEETVPVSLITIRESEQPETQCSPFEYVNHEPVKELMQQIFDSLLAGGKSEEQAKATIMNIEPFNLFPQYLELLK